MFATRRLTANMVVFQRTVYLLAITLAYLVGHSSGLRLTSMNTPLVADVREEMELRCEFDLGVEDLYGVKWYKDDHEFFRFMPGPKLMSYPVAGVHVVPDGANCSHDHCNVRLHKLSRAHSGGAYRCEISGEGPQFRLASETHQITVAALPRENPRIEGLTTSYTEGETLAAKCISDRSDPAPILSWSINGQPAPPGTVGPPTSTEADSLGLVSRSITLLLPVDRKMSRGATSIEVRCESALPGVPLPARAATHSVPLRTANDPQINNQKLHWYSFANRCDPAFHIAWLLILVVATHWSIRRFLK